MFLKNSNATREQAATQPAAAPTNKKGTPTIIASDINILGNVISEGTIDMDGHVDGTIKGAQITIRQNGVVKGDVLGDTVHVYGEVKGIIKAKTVILFSSCRVEGVIMHESLTIEDGAFVDGKFKRIDKMDAANDHEEVEGYDETLSDDMDRRSIRMLENIKLVTG